MRTTTSPFDALAVSTGAGLVLSVLAFIAAIVVTILLYQKFISEKTPAKTPEGKRDWGPFFRFETLLIEKILKVLYLFLACLIAFEAIAAAISSLIGIIYSPGTALVGVITALIVGVILEVLNRLGFEFTMITILIWKNTSEIRKSMQAGSSPAVPTAPVDPAPSTPTNTAPVAPTPDYVAPHAAAPTNTAPHAATTHAEDAPTATAKQPSTTVPSATAPMPAATEESSKKAEASSESSSQDTGWTCASCGATNKSGS